MLPGQGQTSCLCTRALAARGTAVWLAQGSLVLGRCLLALRACVPKSGRRWMLGGRQEGLCLLSWGGMNSPGGEQDLLWSLTAEGRPCMSSVELNCPCGSWSWITLSSSLQTVSQVLGRETITSHMARAVLQARAFC